MHFGTRTLATTCLLGGLLPHAAGNVRQDQRRADQQAQDRLFQQRESERQAQNRMAQQRLADSQAQQRIQDANRRK